MKGPAVPVKEKILQSGIIFTGLSLMVGAGNFFFQRILGSTLQESGEYGAAKTTSVLVNLLGLPVLMASTAIVHHIAHFRGLGNEARLAGLIAGCRQFLGWFTLAAGLVGVALIQPLSTYFKIPRSSLTAAALVSLLIALWSGYASALAQGMGWFKRIALIGLLGVAAKLIFVWVITRQYPFAETAVFAVALGALVNLGIFYWWRDLLKKGDRISPWEPAFFHYLAVAAAGVAAQWCFTQSDVLVVGKYFSKPDQDAYAAAATIASALHLAVSPLLAVLFTARSSERSGRRLTGPLGLLLLYAAGLAGGALVLFFARDFCVMFIFGKPSALASAMIGRLALTMIFVGLTQALGMWALASHWLKVGVLYGGLGLAYWAILLGAAYRAAPINGKLAPHFLLDVMPLTAAGGFLIIFIAWFVSLRRERSV